ncbi:hypothetical protein [Agrococcus versicolor]
MSILTALVPGLVIGTALAFALFAVILAVLVVRSRGSDGRIPDQMRATLLASILCALGASLLSIVSITVF